MIVDAAVDSLLNIIELPGRYDPARGSLLNYLIHVASNKLIDELRRVERRREVGVGGLVELELYESNNVREWYRGREPSNAVDGTDDVPVALLRIVDEVLSDPVDRRIARLIESGRTETASYAEALGLTGLSTSAQRIIVKRYRDRVLKRLQRNRERFRTYFDEF